MECSAKTNANIGSIFNKAIDLIFLKFHKSQLRANWESPFPVMEHSSEGGDYKSTEQQVASLMAPPPPMHESIKINH